MTTTFWIHVDYTTTFTDYFPFTPSFPFFLLDDLGNQVALKNTYRVTAEKVYPSDDRAPRLKYDYSVWFIDKVSLTKPQNLSEVVGDYPYSKTFPAWWQVEIPSDFHPMKYLTGVYGQLEFPFSLDPTPIQPNPNPNPNPNPSDSLNLLNTPFTRFQNTGVSGTYLFAGPSETANIRQNFPSFKEEGIAFRVGIEPGDDLLQFTRFQNTERPGTYLFAGPEEAANIRQNFPNFKEEGIAFYALDSSRNLGTQIYRFQNLNVPGTYLFAGPTEKDNILANFPNFRLEGEAFEVVG